MPRYLVERTFPERLPHPARAEGEGCGGSIERTELEGVRWVHSYVNEERTKIVCVYDAPSAEALRQAAADDLPLDAIIEIRVLDRDFRLRQDAGDAADLQAHPGRSEDA